MIVFRVVALGLGVRTSRAVARWTGAYVLLGARGGRRGAGARGACRRGVAQREQHRQREQQESSGEGGNAAWGEAGVQGVSDGLPAGPIPMFRRVNERD